MTIHDLLSQIPADKIMVQNIFEGDFDVQLTKSGAKITFYTSPAYVTPNSVLSDNSKVGLVLWIDKRDFPKGEQ